MRFWRVVGLGLILVVASPAVLIPFLNRTDFKNGTILATGLPDENGVNFTSPAVCPTSAVSGTAGCSSGAITYGSTGTGSVPATLSFSSIPGLSIQGFSLGSSGQPRLVLYAAGFDHATWLPLTYDAPVLSTRNAFELGGTNLATIKIRVVLPANVDTFAIDLSNGCSPNSNVTGGNNCGPEDNHHGTILVTAKRVGEAVVASDSVVVSTVDNSPTGELTFFGVRSDSDLEYVELTLPAFADAPTNSVANFGSIIATRIAFGEATPEPATLLLTAAGLAILLRRKLR